MKTYAEQLCGNETGEYMHAVSDSGNPQEASPTTLQVQNEFFLHCVNFVP